MELIFLVENWSAFWEQYYSYPLFAMGLLLLSGMVSGFEVAFFSLPSEQARSLEKSTHFSDNNIRFLKKSPETLLATLLVANNLFNIALILLLAYFFMGMRSLASLSPVLWFVIEAVAISSFLLLFGEIIPKVLAANRQMAWLRTFSPFIRLFFYLLFPLSWLLARSSRFFYRQQSSEKQQLSFQELKQAIDLTSELESPKEEKQILKALVDISSIPVRAIMRPRIEVKFLTPQMTPAEVVRFIRSCGYSRIPVAKNDLDNVLGILYVKDVFPILDTPEMDNWLQYIRKPYYVPENKKINKLLNEFKEKRLHIAIVVDEFGGSSGIVTLQDILEDIFGGLHSEFDRNRAIFKREPGGSYLFDSKIPFRDAARVMQVAPRELLPKTEDNPQSLGDIFAADASKPGGPKHVVHTKNYRFEALGANLQAPQKIRVSKLPPAASRKEDVRKTKV